MRNIRKNSRHRSVSIRYSCSTTVFSLLLTATLFANPWGKDSDLAERRCRQLPPKTALEVVSPTRWVGDRLIDFHQNVISPIDHNRCHFRPSCSQYTREAMAKYGLLRGMVCGFDRLMRDNGDRWHYDSIEEEDKSYNWDPVR